MARLTDTQNNSIRVGSWFVWNNVIYQVIEVQGLTLMVLPDSSSEPQSIAISDIFQGKTQTIFCRTRAELEKQIEQMQPEKLAQTIAGLPTHLLIRADDIIKIVKTVNCHVDVMRREAEKTKQKFKLVKTLEEICEELTTPIGLTAYYKYRKICVEHGYDRAKIAASLRRSDANKTRMADALVNFIDTMIMRFYARKKAPFCKPQLIYEKLIPDILKRTDGLWINPALCPGKVPPALIDELLNDKLPMSVILENPEKRRLLTKIKVPSRGWFYGHLKWYKTQPKLGKDTMNALYGPGTWESQFETFDTYVYRATAPLQYTFSDHWWVDVPIVDEETRSKVSHLWFTALIDAYTRAIVGIALLYEAPSIMSIQSTLRHAIWPKTSHTEFGLADWVCYGIPLQLSVDNAWAHYSLSLENTCRAISQGGRFTSIDLAFRPPYHARHGALIESLLGNISAQVNDRFPGGKNWRGNNTTKIACLLYKDIYKAMHEIVVNYMHTPHSGLGGMTPTERWNDWFERMGSPIVPAFTPAVERLFWRLHPQTRPITDKGVSAFNMHYWSSKLGDFPRFDTRGKKIAYHFAYEPDFIGRIALIRGEQWLGDLEAKELRLPDGSLLSISLWEREIAKNLARKHGQATKDWLAYTREARELAQMRMAERRAAQRRAKRDANKKLTPRDTHLMDVALSQSSGDDDYTSYLERWA